MNIHEALETAQDSAHELLVEQFDVKHDIPMRASGHTDLWPGDRWPEAYIAAGEPELAAHVMESIAFSRRPDYAYPHLMQGSHMLAGVETRWIHRQVYRLQGNGAMRLPNGEWVTKALAPPTQALSALAVVKAGLEVHGPYDTLTPAALARSTRALYAQRGNEKGLITAHKKDELTRSTAELSQRLKAHGSVVDVAVNALSVQNNRAIIELAKRTDVSLGEEFTNQVRQIEEKLVSVLQIHRFIEEILPEDVLATARTPQEARSLSESLLTNFYMPPEPADPHPEISYLSMAETIEVARLTPWSEASHDYLERILPKIAQAGASAMTRFEGITPGKNAVDNKVSRKQIWLPTAAQIVQIDANSL
ncbi:MAG TPA: hypothetical protein VN031_00880 [Candidatus Microsaccharimonas sp.]|nr:hypothetical protein [Candidatus Microsaccharimonas sp.]